MICANCGEELGGLKVVIEGKQYHPDCVARDVVSGNMMPKCNMEQLEDGRWADEAEVICCNACGKVRLISESERYGDSLYCPDCLMVCPNCGDKFWQPEDERVVVEEYEEAICPDCQENGDYVCCEECGQWVSEDDAFRTVEDKWICRDCRNRNYVLCHGCGRYVFYGDAFNDCRENFYCDDCYGEYTFMCDACGEVFPDREMNVRDGDHLCDSCYEDANENDEDDDDEDDEGRHEYDYKLSPMVYLLGSGEQAFQVVPDERQTMFGLEIEMEMSNEGSSLNLHRLKELMNEPEMLYKRDGSLERGVECVTAPMTMKYINETFKNDIKKFTKLATEMGYRSHDTSTCGLHIHTSQWAYDSKHHAVRTARFINSSECWPFVELFSRRKSWRYCQRCTGDPQNAGKYTAVNLENMRHNGLGTIEFRIFRGTLKWTSIMAAIQFCDLAIEVARTSVSEADCEFVSPTLSYEDMVFLAVEKKYSYFLDYCENRGIFRELGINLEPAIAGVAA